MNKLVYVVGGDPLVCRMFLCRGWAVADEQSDLTKRRNIDLRLVCFTGGEDVSPEIYGEENQGSRGCNLSRDQEEVEVYNHYVGKVPLVGICRGGQLLNVLNGGKMIQDLGETVSGMVYVRRWHNDYQATGYSLMVDHHQGMKRGYTFAKGQFRLGDLRYQKIVQHLSPEYVLYYPKTRSFCFQPHPEWGHEGTEGLFFELLEDYLGVS